MYQVGTVGKTAERRPYPRRQEGVDEPSISGITGKYNPGYPQAPCEDRQGVVEGINGQGVLVSSVFMSGPKYHSRNTTKGNNPSQQCNTSWQSDLSAGFPHEEASYNAHHIRSNPGLNTPANKQKWVNH